MKILRNYSLPCAIYMMAAFLVLPAFAAPTAPTAVSAKERAEQDKLDKEKLDKEAEAKRDLMIEAVLSSISKWSCGFKKFEFSSESKAMFGIPALNVDCWFLFDHDNEYNIIAGKFEDYEENKIKDKTKKDVSFGEKKFASSVVVKTKGLLIKWTIDRSGIDTRISARIYAGIADPKTHAVDQRKLVEGPLTMALANKLNDSTVTLNLHSIDVNIREVPGNPDLIMINGYCNASQKIHNFLTGKPEIRPMADCYVKGSYDFKSGPKINAGFNEQPELQQVAP